MREFFSLDGPLQKYGGYVADTLIMSLMWLVFSLPIFTIGASTAALFYVSTRRIAEREGYITSDFWHAFKANFKRGTILWLLVLLVGLILFFNIMVDMERTGTFGAFMWVAQFIFLLQLWFICVFLFPITARFDMGVIQTIKSSFFMGNRHLLTTLTCTVLMVAILISVFLTNGIMFFVAPGIYAMLSSYMIMRVFKKYRPEMDKDPRLEIQEIEAQKAEERRRLGKDSDLEDNSEE
jgi:uncharacterized membrane protein YesL